MKDIKIYVMAHKEFEVPKDTIYVPIQVGAELHESLGYTPDNTGDNISAKNPYFNELSGLYWMWKNGPACDITGLCHYRRYFLNENDELLTASEIEKILAGYDAIVTDRVTYLEGNVYESYATKHYAKDLDLTRDAIARLCPDYLASYDEVMNGKSLYYANMIVTGRENLDRYCEWLFMVLFDVESNLDMTGYDDYDKRVYGFISERLLYVWLKKNGLRLWENHVGVMGMKSETREAIKKAAGLLADGDFHGALVFLEEENKRRPDLFYKDSDIYGELASIYTFATIMVMEEKAGKNNLISYSRDYKVLLKLYDDLKKSILDVQMGMGLFEFVRKNNLSVEFVLVTISKAFENDKEGRVRTYNYLANAYLDIADIKMAGLYVEMALREEKA